MKLIHSLKTVYLYLLDRFQGYFEITINDTGISPEIIRRLLTPLLIRFFYRVTRHVMPLFGVKLLLEAGRETLPLTAGFIKK